MIEIDPIAWNYLRVRGEYRRAQRISNTMVELPPRARRIHNLRIGTIRINGTTSACAENTGQVGPRRGRWWNYLRVRGEYIRQKAINLPAPELPPRARRIRDRG